MRTYAPSFCVNLSIFCVHSIDRDPFFIHKLLYVIIIREDFRKDELDNLILHELKINMTEFKSSHFLITLVEKILNFIKLKALRKYFHRVERGVNIMGMSEL